MFVACVYVCVCVCVCVCVSRVHSCVLFLKAELLEVDMGLPLMFPFRSAVLKRLGFDLRGVENEKESRDVVGFAGHVELHCFRIQCENKSILRAGCASVSLCTALFPF